MCKCYTNRAYECLHLIRRYECCCRCKNCRIDPSTWHYTQPICLVTGQPCTICTNVTQRTDFSFGKGFNDYCPECRKRVTEARTRGERITWFRPGFEVLTNMWRTREKRKVPAKTWLYGQQVAPGHEAPVGKNTCVGDVSVMKRSNQWRRLI